MHTVHCVIDEQWKRNRKKKVGATICFTKMMRRTCGTAWSCTPCCCCLPQWLPTKSTEGHIYICCRSTLHGSFQHHSTAPLRAPSSLWWRNTLETGWSESPLWRGYIPFHWSDIKQSCTAMCTTCTWSSEPWCCSAWEPLVRGARNKSCKSLGGLAEVTISCSHKHSRENKIV